ncbi:hypothetical protein BJY04DRAFT_217086 [Aspergillus karnatakaensis]|uniref:oxidase ustYa family protein n=1 Tax=Aspergillus karnatakaensis TaxID=1810916 RepID=UPI003CCD4DDD
MFWQLFQRNYRFQTLRDESSYGDEGDDEKDPGDLPCLMRNSGKKAALSTFWWTCLTTANLAMLVITVSVYMNSRGTGIMPYEKNAILRPVSWWSPILDAIEIPSYDTMLNGTLFPLPEISIAREEPGPENDAKWAEYEKILTIVVTREEIVKLGKDPDTVARFEDAYWGLGDDAYMVQFDVMHQIHCLNILRRAAYAEYPGYVGMTDARDKMWWIHIGHCLDIVLQNIKCNANTEVLTLAWVEGRRTPWPDFSINRKCRDVNTLIDYQLTNTVDPDKFDRMVRPKDAYVRPAPWKKQETELGVVLGQHHLQEGHPKNGG